jgi:hypothetical protein
MPSFGGIKRDCDSIVSELKSQLKSKLSNNETSPAEMSECVNLLLQLVIFKVLNLFSIKYPLIKHTNFGVWGYPERFIYPFFHFFKLKF